jgi:methyltransferase (TIGR00027 family)
MIEPNNTPFQLSSSDADVAETCLLTLSCHALDSLSEDPILRDDKAVELIQTLKPALATAESRMLRKLATGKIDQRLVVFISLRAKHFDDYSREFLARNPNGTIVNLGCGMDSRFQRVDNGQMRFFDIDLPDVIALKKKLFEENERYTLLGTSVLAFDWMDQLIEKSEGPVLFLAEGLLMYLEPERVKELVLILQSRFPGAELVCEVFNKAWLGPMMKKIASGKMQRRFQMGKNAEFKFGLAQSDEMEQWNPGIIFLDEWSYFDSDHPRLGALRWFRNAKLFRYTQWVVHYRLG